MVGGRQQRVTGVDSRTCHMVGGRQQRVTGVDSRTCHMVGVDSRGLRG